MVIKGDIIEDIFFLSCKIRFFLIYSKMVFKLFSKPQSEVRVEHIILLIIFVNTFLYLRSVNWGWYCIIKSTIYTNTVCLWLLLLFLFSHWTVITGFWEAQFIIRSVSNATTFHMKIPLILTVTGWITRLTLIDQKIWRWWGSYITPITVSCRKYLLLIMLLERWVWMRYQIRP